MRENIYFFKVTLNEYKEKEVKDEVYREMMLKGTTSLHQFAETIIGAFRLRDMDTAFCFYSEMKDADGNVLQYTNMADVEPISKNESYERGVKNAYIHDIFHKGKELPFLYDFDYSCKFSVGCCDIVDAEVGETFSLVTKEVGEVPTDDTGSDE